MGRLRLLVGAGAGGGVFRVSVDNRLLPPPLLLRLLWLLLGLFFGLLLELVLWLLLWLVFGLLLWLVFGLLLWLLRLLRLHGLWIPGLRLRLRGLIQILWPILHLFGSWRPMVDAGAVQQAHITNRTLADVYTCKPRIRCHRKKGWQRDKSATFEFVLSQNGYGVVS